MDFDTSVLRHQPAFSLCLLCLLATFKTFFFHFCITKCSRHADKLAKCVRVLDFQVPTSQIEQMLTYLLQAGPVIHPPLQPFSSFCPPRGNPCPGVLFCSSHVAFLSTKKMRAALAFRKADISTAKSCYYLFRSPAVGLLKLHLGPQRGEAAGIRNNVKMFSMRIGTSTSQPDIVPPSLPVTGVACLWQVLEHVWFLNFFVYLCIIFPCLAFTIYTTLVG